MTAQNYSIQKTKTGDLMTNEETNKIYKIVKIPNYFKIVPIVCGVISVALVAVIVPNKFESELLIMFPAISLLWNIIEFLDFKEIKIEEEVKVEK